MEEQEIVGKIRRVLKRAAEDEITLNRLLPRLTTGSISVVWENNRTHLIQYFRDEWSKARRSEMHPRRLCRLPLLPVAPATKSS